MTAALLAQADTIRALLTLLGAPTEPIGPTPARVVVEHMAVAGQRFTAGMAPNAVKHGFGGPENGRVLRLESRYAVEWLLPAASVSRLHLLCPDPWPKARHHRRRVVQAEFLEAVRRVLAPGGEFLFMTDHQEYFEWAGDKVAGCRGLEPLEWLEDSFFYPKTDFQEQWESEGKTMWRLRCRKPLSPV